MTLSLSCKLSLVLLTFSWTIYENTANTSPIVETTLGSIQGRYHVSRNGLQYPVFLGIKYGTVSQRFEISQPVGPWDGIKDATNFGIHCAQKSIFQQSSVTGEEDCLSLNVFTPKVDNRKRAVLFYVHGGGFNFGSGAEYNGGFLVDEDIVLVTMNYRLGILGFLNSGDDLVTGNMGLKDLLLALQWVNRHIEAFGGDPKRVTLGGNSAGSILVQILMIYPPAQGLFSGIFGSSGTLIMNERSFVFEPAKVMKEVGQNLHCNTENNVELIKCFRHASLNELVVQDSPSEALTLAEFKVKPTLDFQNHPSLNTATLKPRDFILQGNFPKVPTLLTMTKDEGALIYAFLLLQNPNLRDQILTNFSHVAPITFLYKDSVLQSHQNEITEGIFQHYLGYDLKENEAIDVALANIYSDVYLNHGIHEFALALGSVTSVYAGLLTHARKDFSAVDILGLNRSNWEVVSHCDDLSYIFDITGETDKVPWPHLGELKTSHDIDFSRKYTKMLASFLSTGVPTMPFGSKPSWSPVTKEEVESNALNWMELDSRDDVSLLINPFGERMRIWGEVHNPTKGKEEL